MKLKSKLISTLFDFFLLLFPLEKSRNQELKDYDLLICLSMLIHEENGIPCDVIMMELTTFPESLNYTAKLLNTSIEEVYQICKDLLTNFP